jgi:hypothetical protein
MCKPLPNPTPGAHVHEIELDCVFFSNVPVRSIASLSSIESSQQQRNVSSVRNGGSQLLEGDLRSKE